MIEIEASLTQLNKITTHLIQTIPKEAFDGADFEPEEGMIILAGGVPATIIKVSDSEVVLDFNHQLAGNNLIFTIKVVDVVNGEE